MVWRVLLLLLKSALVVALFELMRPVADTVGLQLQFVGIMAAALARATHLPYAEAETLFLFVGASTCLELAAFAWNFVTGNRA